MLKKLKILVQKEVRYNAFKTIVQSFEDTDLKDKDKSIGLCENKCALNSEQIAEEKETLLFLIKPDYISRLLNILKYKLL